ncbi:MAG: RNA polymerase sigma factor, partial [Planctomycetota bacterium]
MSSDSTRWTIIRGAAHGVPEDQAEFAKRYGPIVRAYLGARWRQTPLFDHVDDAAQQVFLDCFSDDGALGRADPERGTGFRAFLYGVARNVARGIERTRARSREHQLGSGLDFESKEESCATVFDRAWAQALMRDAAELQLERARAKGPEAVRRHRLLAL